MGDFGLKLGWLNASNLGLPSTLSRSSLHIFHYTIKLVRFCGHGSESVCRAKALGRVSRST